MLAYPKNATFWQSHKLHVLVAVLVLMLHGVLVYALWRARADSLPESEPVAVRLIDEAFPPAPSVSSPPSVTAAMPLSPKHVFPRHARSPMPAVSSIEISASIRAPVAASPETMGPASASVGTLQPTTTGQTNVPASVSSDLSLACPVRAAPVYPLTSRKLDETGKVVLRIELDETGRLVASDITRSSGFARLDEAAQTAVKSWRCQPAMRDGQALRVVSMESFDFRLGD